MIINVALEFNFINSFAESEGPSASVLLAAPGSLPKRASVPVFKEEDGAGGGQGDSAAAAAAVAAGGPLNYAYLQVR